MGDIASKKKIPEELLRWIIDAGTLLLIQLQVHKYNSYSLACLEPRDDLRYSYIYTLKVYWIS